MTMCILHINISKTFLNIITGVRVQHFDCTRLNWIMLYFRCDFKTDSVVLNIHETLYYLLKIYNSRPIKHNDHACQKNIFCSLYLAKTINNQE